LLTDVRMFAIELLRSYKKIFKYRDLEEITGLPAPALWRYINMKIIPSVERAKEIVNRLTLPSVINRIFENNIITVDGNIFNLSRIIYNVSILKIFSYLAFREFSGYGITAVATVEVDGIPIAVNVADALNAKLVIARRRPDVGIKNYYQTSYIARDPPAVINLFLPADSLNEGDRVLIVDDLLNTGRTSLALIKLIRMANAEPVGIFSILAIGKKWKYALEKAVKKIYVIKQVNVDEQS